MRCYYFFIFEVIVESVNLIADAEIEKKIIITMIGNNYFFENLHQNTEQKERCFCDYIIARNEEFQFTLFFYKKQ